MKPPVRWISPEAPDRPDPRVVTMLESAAQVDEWPEARYERVRRRAAETLAGGRRRALRTAGAAALAVGAAAALLLVVLRRPAPGAEESRWRTVELGSLGSLQVTADAQLRLGTEAEDPDERRAYLLAGSARAHVAKQDPRRPFALVTPHFRVVVVGTRFSVSVAGDLSAVSVEEGRVRVESAAGGSLLLGAGERADSRDPRLKPAPPTPAAAPAPALPMEQTASGCPRSGPLAERKQCLRRLSQGAGLEAQNALYALGLMARDEERDSAGAIEAWGDYRRRFAQGLLAPEASLDLLRELLVAKRHAEALAQAEQFQESFPGDPRAAEVSLIRAKLLCTRFGRLAQAQTAFGLALSSARGEVREDAVYARAACVELLSGPEVARAAWRRYLEEFPDGPHAGAVRSRLAP